MMISTQFGPADRVLGAEAAARLLAESGFEALDFGIHVYANYPYCARAEGESLFDRGDEEVLAFFRELYATIRSAGLVVGQTHAPFPSSEVRGEEVALPPRSYRLAELALRITQEMDCRLCVIHPVFSGCFDYDRRPDKQKEFHDLNMEFYLRLAPVAKETGVKICLENMWGSVQRGVIVPAVISHAPEFAAWIDELNERAGAELFCACLDTGHAILTGDDPCEMLRVLGPRVQCLHMHDVHPNRDSHTMPFEGICKWNELAAALRETGYSGTLNFESGSFQNTKPAPLMDPATRFLGLAVQYFRTLVEQD